MSFSNRCFVFDQMLLIVWEVKVKFAEICKFNEVEPSKEKYEEYSKLYDDVNSLDKKTGNTLLHGACAAGDMTLIDFLTGSVFVELNVKNKDGLTPLQLALQHQKFNVVKYMHDLIKFRASS